MKIICKIIEHIPDTKQIVFRICRLHSLKSIDEHIKCVVCYDDLDMTDFESFKVSLIKKFQHQIQVDDEKQSILKENTPIEDLGLDIDKLVGKVFSGEYVDKSTRLLKMRRVKL